MSVPICLAHGCEGVATRGGLCESHRGCRLLTATLADAIGAFLNRPQGARLQSTVDLKDEQVRRKVELAGSHFAHGLALLVQARFNTDEIVFEQEPITLGSASVGADVNWRVNFSWQAGKAAINFDELEDVEPDDDGDDAI